VEIFGFFENENEASRSIYSGKFIDEFYDYKLIKVDPGYWHTEFLRVSDIYLDRSITCLLEDYNYTYYIILSYLKTSVWRCREFFKLLFHVNWWIIADILYGFMSKTYVRIMYESVLNWKVRKHHEYLILCLQSKPPLS